MRQNPILYVLFLIIILLTIESTSGAKANPIQPPIPGQGIAVRSAPLLLGNKEIIRRIPAPEAIQHEKMGQAPVPEDFIITYEGDWSEDAKNAFNYAASIWSLLIDPSVKINITARSGSCFFCGAQSYVYLEKVPNLPRADTWYPRALANHLSASDNWPNDFDFVIVYDPIYVDWYFGTDGNTPGNQYDFVTAILHEIGHGLGFVDSFMMGGFGAGMGSWGSPNPIIYDTFIVNGDGQSLLDTSLFPTPSLDLGTQLTSDNIFFDGPKTRSANQNMRAKLDWYHDPHGYSPTTLSHLNEIYYGTPNELMTSTIWQGESIHDPGQITLGILADLGWTLSPNLPTMFPLPSQMILANTQRINAIDLWGFVPAGQSPGTNFTFSIDNEPAPEAGVSLHDNRYIDLAPASDWLGNTDVTIKAENLKGLSVSATFKVFVVAELHTTFLPSIHK